MCSLTSRILVAKVFVQGQSVSELEKFFQRKWCSLRAELEHYFSELPGSKERMALFEEQLEKNNRRKYREVDR